MLFSGRGERRQATTRGYLWKWNPMPMAWAAGHGHGMVKNDLLTFDCEEFEQNQKFYLKPKGVALA